MSITKVNAKIHKLRLFDEAINNLIYGQYCKKTIKEEFQNLENYPTWRYEKLPPWGKTIGLK